MLHFFTCPIYCKQNHGTLARISLSITGTKNRGNLCGTSLVQLRGLIDTWAGFTYYAHVNVLCFTLRHLCVFCTHGTGEKYWRGQGGASEAPWHGCCSPAGAGLGALSAGKRRVGMVAEVSETGYLSDDPVWLLGKNERYMCMGADPWRAQRWLEYLFLW